MQHMLLFTRSVLRAGIHAILKELPNCSLCHATTQCPEEMAELARRCGPTVTLFDMTCLPVVALFSSLGKDRIKSFGAIVVATMSGLDEEELFRLAMWGIAAHISGDTEPEELAATLHRVTCGEYLLSDACLRKRRVPALSPRNAPMIEERPVLTQQVASTAGKSPLLPSPLTEDEEAILCCIAQGMTNKQVAYELSTTISIVHYHITSIFKKLQVCDRTSAVVSALQANWIQMPEVLRTRELWTAVA